MNISRQIGWSNESNLLYQILKQLTKLTGVIFNLTPKYKVYTALLTQSGGDNIVNINGSDLTIGVTYQIDDSSGGADYTNVGAPNNDNGTYFVATGTTPNSWGTGGGLNYNTGAPVVTVLENTIGNIWFTYNNTGNYFINSDGLFLIDKTVAFNSVCSDAGDPAFINIQVGDQNTLSLSNFNLIGPRDGIGLISIEIRVYN